jgi:hypothetical protein
MLHNKKKAENLINLKVFLLAIAIGDIIRGNK